jgi:hypothetical protein
MIKEDVEVDSHLPIPVGLPPFLKIYAEPDFGQKVTMLQKATLYFGSELLPKCT